MKTLFDRLNDMKANALAPLRRHPLLFRATSLLVALALYVVGVAAVTSLTSVTFLVVLTALYFLPALLRAWLLFYWQLRKEWKGLNLRRAASRG